MRNMDLRCPSEEILNKIFHRPLISKLYNKEMERKLRGRRMKYGEKRAHREAHTQRQKDKRTRDVIICVRIVRLASMAESFDISWSLIKLERIIAPRREGESRSNVVVVRRLLPKRRV